MLVIDSHLDLSWNALNWNRDLNLTVPEMRAMEAGMKEQGRGTNTVSFPQMREGEVGISFATLLARSNPAGKEILDFRSQQIAYSMAQGQLAFYRLLEQQGTCRILHHLADLKESYAAWNSGVKTAPLGFIISMEGADPIISPNQVPAWWEDGLRAVGLAHYGPSAYAHGTGCSGGLTAKGRELLRAMQDAGMILDVTHLADQSFWEAVKLFPGPILASHNNCRALVPGDRQFDDDQIRLIIERDGVLGAAFDAWMLVPNWNPGAPTHPSVTLEAVIDNIDHICQLAGNAKHVAIGSDLDGGFGTEQCPEGLDTIVDLQKIPVLLRKRGYPEADVEGVMYGNWMRFFERVWGG